MQVKIKKLREDAQIPKYADNGCAGIDITATSVEFTNDYIEYGTGLAFELPPGYVMLIFPRSSVSKKDLLLANGVGVLDSSYRGELKFRYKRSYRALAMDENYRDETVLRIPFNCYKDYAWSANKVYSVGERVGQIIILPYPQIEFEEVSELSDTERGDGGFGSTGK